MEELEVMGEKLDGFVSDPIDEMSGCAVRFLTVGFG